MNEEYLFALGSKIWVILTDEMRVAPAEVLQVNVIVNDAGKTVKYNVIVGKQKSLTVTEDRAFATIELAFEQLLLELGE